MQGAQARQRGVAAQDLESETISQEKPLGFGQVNNQITLLDPIGRPANCLGMDGHRGKGAGLVKSSLGLQDLVIVEPLSGLKQEEVASQAARIRVRSPVHQNMENPDPGALCYVVYESHAVLPVGVSQLGQLWR